MYGMKKCVANIDSIIIWLFIATCSIKFLRNHSLHVKSLSSTNENFIFWISDIDGILSVCSKIFIWLSGPSDIYNVVIKLKSYRLFYELNRKREWMSRSLFFLQIFYGLLFNILCLFKACAHILYTSGGPFFCNWPFLKPLRWNLSHYSTTHGSIYIFEATCSSFSLGCLHD